MTIRTDNTIKLLSFELTFSTLATQYQTVKQVTKALQESETDKRWQ